MPHASGVFVATQPERQGQLAVSIKGKFKTAWCTLKQENLLIHRTQADTKLTEATIFLDGVVQEDPVVPTIMDEGAECNYSFRFSFMAGMTKHEFAAGTEEEMKLWIEDIRRLAAVLKYSLQAQRENGEPIDEVVDVINRRGSELDLSGNLMTINNVKAVSAWLITPTNDHITHLSLRNSGLTDPVLLTLHPLLSSSTVIQSLDFSKNTLTDDGIAQLAQELYVNITLTCLDVSSNMLGPESAKALADVLCGNETLEVLKLNCNEIGPSGAALLGSALGSNTTLATLEMASNGIGDAGLQGLAQHLCKSKSLKVLNIDDNAITDSGFKVLSEVISTNSSITHLNVAGNHMTEEGADVIADSIKRNNVITKINFGGNPGLGSEGMMKLSELLGIQFNISKLRIARP